MACSPDGRRIASLSFDGRQAGMLRLREAATGKLLHQLKAADDCQGELAFAPDGRLVAAGAGMDTVRLWETDTGRAVRAMSGTPQKFPVPFPLTYSPDGRTVAVGSFADNGVYVFEVATGGLRCRLAGDAGMVRALAFAPDGRRLLSGGGDTTALVWDLRGGRAVPPAPAEVDRLWADLGGRDATQAYRALIRLAATPAQTPGRLRQELVPVKGADGEQVAGWVRDLDSSRFAVRRAAARELARAGDSAEPVLRRALKARPSAEVRSRIERLLADLGPGSPKRLRQSRLLELLEWTDTPEARRLLDELAGGAAGAWLTEQARELRRLQRRSR